MSTPEFAAAASRLCTACGLCCNGALFHVVKLQPGDSVKELEALGMTLSRKKSEPYFRQPCRFLNDCTCTQYAARPARCRLFECQQIKRLAAGEIAEAQARTAIDAAKQRVAAVERLLEKLGNADLYLPLFERCALVLASEDRDEESAVFQRLVEEMRELNVLLNEGFRLVPHGHLEKAAKSVL